MVICSLVALQFLYLIYGYLFFRCLEKVFEEKKARIKKEIVEVLQQASYRRKRSDDEIRGFDLGFVG